jgi:hypothetical protein
MIQLLGRGFGHEASTWKAGLWARETVGARASAPHMTTIRVQAHFIFMPVPPASLAALRLCPEFPDDRRMWKKANDFPRGGEAWVNVFGCST